MIDPRSKDLNIDKLKNKWHPKQRISQNLI